MSTRTESAPLPGGAAADPNRTTLADRVLGAVGGAMIVFAVVLLFVGGPSDGDLGAASDAPGLEMLQPAHSATIRTERLVVVFGVEGDFGPIPGGWGTEVLHLHLALNGIELMPGPQDIERVSPGVYRWTLPRPDPGLHTLRLVWAGPDHRAIEGAGSRTVQVRVEE